MAAIDGLLVALKERSGSDLHLAAGTPPRLRVKGNEKIQDKVFLREELHSSAQRARRLAKSRLLSTAARRQRMG